MTGQRRIAAVLAAAFGMIAANAASAETTGLYFGLTGGATSGDASGSKQDRDEAVAIPIAVALESEGFDVLGIESSLDDSDSGWGLPGGSRVHTHLDAEIGY